MQKLKYKADAYRDLKREILDEAKRRGLRLPGIYVENFIRKLKKYGVDPAEIDVQEIDFSSPSTVLESFNRIIARYERTEAPDVVLHALSSQIDAAVDAYLRGEIDYRDIRQLIREMEKIDKRAARQKWLEVMARIKHRVRSRPTKIRKEDENWQYILSPLTPEKRGRQSGGSSERRRRRKGITVVAYFTTNTAVVYNKKPPTVRRKVRNLAEILATAQRRRVWLGGRAASYTATAEHVRQILQKA